MQWGTTLRTWVWLSRTSWRSVCCGIAAVGVKWLRRRTQQWLYVTSTFHYRDCSSSCTRPEAVYRAQKVQNTRIDQTNWNREVKISSAALWNASLRVCTYFLGKNIYPPDIEHRLTLLFADNQLPRFHPRRIPSYQRKNDWEEGTHEGIRLSQHRSKTLPHVGSKASWIIHSVEVSYSVGALSKCQHAARHSIHTTGGGVDKCVVFVCLCVLEGVCCGNSSWGQCVFTMLRKYVVSTNPLTSLFCWVALM